MPPNSAAITSAPSERSSGRIDVFSPTQCEHDDEQHEHGDRARVHEHLNEREELGGQQQEQSGDSEHRLEQPERRVHDVARREHAESTAHGGEGEHAERDAVHRLSHEASPPVGSAAAAESRVAASGVSLRGHRDRLRRALRGRRGVDIGEQVLDEPRGVGHRELVVVRHLDARRTGTPRRTGRTSCTRPARSGSGRCAWTCPRQS